MTTKTTRATEPEDRILDKAEELDRIFGEDTEVKTLIICAKQTKQRLDELLEAANQARCDCTVLQRESGHQTGCWMPDLISAIAKAEGK